MMPNGGPDRGQTGHKRTPTQRERDKGYIAQLSAVGKSLTQIKAKLDQITEPEGYTIGLAQINVDLNERIREWKTNSFDAFNEQRNRQIVQIAWEMQELYEAWEASKEDRVEESAKRVEVLVDVTSVDKNGKAIKTKTPTTGRTEVNRKTTKRDPSHYYMQQIFLRHERLAKLLGLDMAVPQTLQLTGEVSRAFAIPEKIIDYQTAMRVALDLQQGGNGTDFLKSSGAISDYG